MLCYVNVNVNVMLGYTNVMLCYAMLCYAMLCYVMLCMYAWVDGWMPGWMQCM